MNMRLESLSLWLSRFHCSHRDDEVELPTQFVQGGRLELENAPKIVKFGPHLQIFRTMRRPIKLKIYCSNGKSYDFLVKYGEDLRQDQRIQHIFSLMNAQLASDRMCKQRDLTISTYSVVPLTSFSGILSFVEDSIPLIQLIRCGPQAADKYSEFIFAATKIKDASLDIIYGEAAANYTPQEVHPFASSFPQQFEEIFYF